jgi:hypothetical protein
MDEIDRAQNEVERSLGEAMRLRKPEGPVATGRCLYCESLLEPGRRWCDSICREDWETELSRGR